jgi:2-C-methyl-D-erythritol 2,4-cyclodiphosphate synthase
LFRIGHGIDIHRLKSGRKLKLGGVEIPFERGLDGHSDADVILHAISDALLGALGLGDIGEYFPGDEKNKDRDSREILAEVIRKIWDEGYFVNNVDCTLLSQAPQSLLIRAIMFSFSLNYFISLRLTVL